MRRPSKRIALAVLVAGVVAVAATLAATLPAAVAGASSSLKVTSAEKAGACTPAGQAYLVHTIVTVANGNPAPITIVKGDWSAKGKSQSGDFTASAAASSGDTLAGSTVPARTTSTYRVHVSTVVPCDASSAQVCVDLTIQKDGTTGTTGPKCAYFVKDAKVVVPAGTIGLLGLTLLLGAALALTQTRAGRRRRRPIAGAR